MEEMDIKNKQIKVSKIYVRKWMIIVALLVVIALVAAFYMLRYSTYDYVEIVKTYKNESTDRGNYTEYAGGVLEYSRDGIAMLSEEGEELWNQPCQMNNPVVEVCEDTAAVADKGGTSICVFQKNGLKGEIKTTRPIEKISVSAQGIVAAILEDEETPKVMCYDATGSVLIEHTASLVNTGYPVDLAISQDGKALLVSYLCTKGNGVVTKACFYHFGEAGADKTNHLVAQKEYVDTIAPTTVFLDKDTSLLVCDNALVFYEGLKEPKETQVVKLDKEIVSVAYEEKYIALILKNLDGTGCELRLYQKNGKQIMSTNFEGEYANIKVSDGQVLLYDGNRCAIFNNAGVCKFKGTLEMNVMNLFPITGLNKYMVISTNGFQEIQLAK